MTTTTCKRCLQFGNEWSSVVDSIDSYITHLALEEKVETILYENRLTQCEACDALINGMCKYCGCFVVVRAIKKSQYCPYPKYPKW